MANEKRVDLFLCIYRKRPGDKKYHPIDYRLQNVMKAEFIYSLNGVINAFVQITHIANHQKEVCKSYGMEYEMSSYQVRDKNGLVYADRMF